MPVMPGLMVMPTVVANTLFSLVKDRSTAVCSPDSLAVVSPMYNEEGGAAQALGSLLEQECYPEQIALSINGGTDATYDIVTDVLHKHAFYLEGSQALPGYNSVVETWISDDTPLRVSVVVYYRKVSKSESVNSLIESGVVAAQRILVVDGDTIFHPGFIERLRENFYRLHIRKVNGKREITLESYGLQSGSVTSFAPPGSSLAQRFISAGRKSEYAFASVLRNGQAKQLTRKGLWGASRLYTVVGCGFTARRDLFPLPTDTQTEDHDFSLQCQNAETRTKELSPSEVSELGFKFIVKGRKCDPSELLEPNDKIILKKSGNARFVDRALMGTEDPPHLSGFIGQIERWNGGAQQNALKRLGKSLKANIHFAVWSALGESVLGIVLILALPLLVALNLGNPSIGIAPLAVGAWFGLDIAITFLLTFYGFIKLRRAENVSKPRSVFRALGDACKNTMPFMVLRWLNPLTYLASATRVIPAHLRRRKTAKTPAKGVTWERAYVRGQTRTQHVFIWTVMVLGAGTFGVANLAPHLNPVNQEAWTLIYTQPRLDMRDFDDPFFLQAQARARLSSPSLAPLTPRPTPDTLSLYCDPSFTRIGTLRQTLQGDPDKYFPLNPYGLLTLTRLAPLAPYLEDAATAYGVPAQALLMVLINESDLDPLAVGPTDDKGLAQVTSDALTLLRGLASDEQSAFYNPRLIPSEFSVYDPDFSICAGAAKLAWAYQQEDVDDLEKAYALYINPLHGLVNGEVSNRHEPLVAAMMVHADMAQKIANTFAVYDTNPGRLTKVELELLTLIQAGRDQAVTLKEAYESAFEISESQNLDDADVYEKVLTSYFGETLSVDETFANR